MAAPTGIRVLWLCPCIPHTRIERKSDQMRHCVLIPARNEGLVLGSTLKSLLASIAPEDIYVINDGSTDDTGIIAASSKVAILTNEVNIGKAASVRRATLHFELTRRYDLISMMDADTVVSPGYFEQVQKAFEKQPDAAAVCGRVKGRRHNWITAYRELQYFLADTVFKAGQHEMGVITVAPGCSTTYRPMYSRSSSGAQIRSPKTWT